MLFYHDILPGLLFELGPWLLFMPAVFVAALGVRHLYRARSRATMLRGLAYLAVVVVFVAATTYRAFFLTAFYVHVWQGKAPVATLRIDGTAYQPGDRPWRRLYLIKHRRVPVVIEVALKDRTLRRTILPEEAVINVDPRRRITIKPTLFTRTPGFVAGYFASRLPKPQTLGLGALTISHFGCGEFMDFDRSAQTKIKSHMYKKTVCKLFADRPLLRF